VRQRLQRLDHIGVTHVSLPPPDQLAALNEPAIAALLGSLRSGPEQNR
jgi:hypothetical protein